MRNLSLFGMAILSSAALAAPLVNTDFEPSINTIGALNLQAANGPNPWTSSGATVTNAGQVLGTQAVNYTSVLAPGAFDHHSRVNLSGGQGITFPTGWKLRASVDVYNDPNHPEIVTALSMWSNGHSIDNGFFGTSGIGARLARHGSNNAPLVGNIANPPDTGWHNIMLEVEQTSANTLTTQYYLDGFLYTHNGFTWSTHVGTFGLSNLVSDFSLVTMNNGSSTQAITGIYDNYRVEIVPEPASFAVLGLGLLGLRRRRKG